MYIARDKIGKLYFHREKPYKFGSQWINDNFYFSIDSSLFPEVKWEDEEPTEIELNILGRGITADTFRECIYMLNSTCYEEGTGVSEQDIEYTIKQRNLK